MGRGAAAWSLATLIHAALGVSLVAAQQPTGGGQGPPQPQPQPQSQSAPRWDGLPMMQLEAFYRGPLMDTVIQRWRDPVDGSICYLYLPITAEHSPTPASPYVQYGANQIGSISCFAGAVMTRPSAQADAGSGPAADPRTPRPKPKHTPAE
jgi:hypothetical protein